MNSYGGAKWLRETNVIINIIRWIMESIRICKIIEGESFEGK